MKFKISILLAVVFQLSLIPFAEVSLARNGSFVMSRSVNFLAELPTDEGSVYEQKMKKREARKNEKKKDSVNCDYVYENQAIKIVKEIAPSNIQIRVKDGVCKGSEGVVSIRDIKVQ